MKILKLSTILLISLLLLTATSCKKTDVAPATQKGLIAADAQTPSLYCARDKTVNF